MAKRKVIVDSDDEDQLEDEESDDHTVEPKGFSADDHASPEMISTASIGEI